VFGHHGIDLVEHGNPLRLDLEAAAQAILMTREFLDERL